MEALFFDHLTLIGSIFAVIAVILFWKSFLWLFGVIIVPDDSLGTVTKKFVIFGANSNLPDGQIVALEGEAGFQADTLSPGLHMGLWPWQYTIELIKFTVIPQGNIGVVQACDGKPLPSGRVIARDVDCNFFQDARAFLKAGGERGPQSPESGGEDLSCGVRRGRCPGRHPTFGCSGKGP